MKEEDKELLLKDLSGRLPHHVRCKIWLKDGTTEEGPLDLQHNYGDVLRDAFYYNKIKDIKPYLRPMSSMTDEEIDMMWDISENYSEAESSSKITDLLNKWNLDHHHLIEKGLAIAVTEENNPYKD